MTKRNITIISAETKSSTATTTSTTSTTTTSTENTSIKIYKDHKMILNKIGIFR